MAAVIDNEPDFNSNLLRDIDLSEDEKCNYHQSASGKASTIAAAKVVLESSR